MKPDEDQLSQAKSSSLLAITFRKFLNFLGFAGIVSILYGVVSGLTDSHWEPLERWVNFFSSFLTILGAFVTATTVYIWSRQPHPPEKFSTYVSAPLVMAGAVTAMLALILRGTLPISVVNGFALLAIAGALFRIQPHTSE